VFHRSNGPGNWANARLVRYADDFVVMTHYQGKRLQGWIEEKLENWMGLEINREKTRVVDLRKDGESVDFLGYTFRRDRDLRGRGHRYLNVFPSKKSVARERARLRKMTSSRNCFKPVSLLVGELNRQIYGWGNYFRFGYSREAFREIDWYVRERMSVHLQRRSQRAFRVPEGSTLYEHLNRMGLVYL
jgi:RNA-directed DNA polymerase